MPRILRPAFPTQANPYVLGIDGCPDGWVAIALPAKGRISSVQAKIYQDFATIMIDHRNKASAIMVDMPIGLMQCGRRHCESLARQHLGKRSSSVFASPRRPMLTMKTYEEANRWGKSQGNDSGGGLSKQAWNILPKIKEIDLAITSKDQSFLGEAHPELAFARLNNAAPCQFPKKTDSGALERVALLKKAGIRDPGKIIQDLKEQTTLHAKSDDVLDATAIALSARARLSGKAIHCFDGALDKRGLKMEIWG